MRLDFLLAALAALFASALAGCTGDDSSTPPPPADAAVVDATTALTDAGAGVVPCTPGLLDQPPFCDGSTCITRDEALAPAPVVCDAIRPAGAGTLECGSHTVVLLDEPHGFEVLWFDDAGALAALGGGRDIGNGFDRCASRGGAIALPPTCGGVGIDFDLGCRCPPGPPPASPPPSKVVAPPVTRGSCTDSQAGALVDCALHLGDAGAACDPLADAGSAGDRACAACLFGDGSNGAILLRGAGTYNARPNVAGCIAALEGDAGAGSCAASYAAAADCAAASCATQCYAASATAEIACGARAIDGDCATGIAAAACFGAHGADGGALAAACGVSASAREQARAVARVICGGAITDAGAD